MAQPSAPASLTPCKPPRCSSLARDPRGAEAGRPFSAQPKARKGLREDTRGADAVAAGPRRAPCTAGSRRMLEKSSRVARCTPPHPTRRISAPRPPHRPEAGTPRRNAHIGRLLERLRPPPGHPHAESPVALNERMHPHRARGGVAAPPLALSALRRRRRGHRWGGRVPRVHVHVTEGGGANSVPAPPCALFL